ncbi:MAG: CapA family protein [Chloroflexota bacterium]|nr:CapA family protein [Chloroflexota bacterium]
MSRRVREVDEEAVRGAIGLHPPVPHLLVCSLLIYSLFALPGKPAPPTTTLAFVGDVMLGRGVAQSLDGDWDAAFAEVRPWLEGADLAFANLESPLATALPPLSSPSTMGGTEGGRYDLRAPPEAVAALRAAGFDIVSLANNHALDAGNAGLAQTIAKLNAAGITGLVDWETNKPTNYQTNKLPNYPTNSPAYRFLAFDDSVAPLDLEAAAGVVAAAAGQAEVVVVSIHWGGEYQAAPGPRQRAVARALADAGAGIIVGHGPHVLQQVEWIEETLVAYSLGNFLFDQPYPVDCRWGAILRVTLQGDHFVAVEAIPTVAEHGRVRPASPATAAAIHNRIPRSINREPLPSLSARRPSGRD